MIVVIADDFTGAAELAGIGLRYNLNIEVNTQVNLQSKADLLIIATDTRSMQKQKAEEHMLDVTKKIAQLKSKLVFKKVDSVLRGYVIEELIVHLAELGLNQALLIPANPKLGRIIKNGHYFVNGQPIHLSSFSNDPEFAIKSSLVKEMLYKNSIPVHVQHKKEILGTEGIIVGEAENEDDLQFWAAQHNESILAAGASGFFTALLNHHNFCAVKEARSIQLELNQPLLWIAGSAFSRSCDEIKQYKNQGFPVSYLPAEMIASSEINENQCKKWCQEITSFLQTSGKAIIAIDPESTQNLIADSKLLREQMAVVIKMVFDEVNILELLIEGGSTASAVFKKLGFTRFFPVEELAPGVIRVNTETYPDLNITLKPGSYVWPTAIMEHASFNG